MNYFLIFIVTLISSFIASMLSKFVFTYLQAKAMVKVSNPIQDIFSGLNDFLGDFDEEE